MVRGRNTTYIGLRLPDEVIEKLRVRAGELSIGLYIKQQILKSMQKEAKDESIQRQTNSEGILEGKEKATKDVQP